MAVSRAKLEKICDKNPTSILFARLADVFLQQGNTVRASEICRRGLRYRPSYVTGHVVMGKCHLAAKRFEEARQEFQKVFQLDSDNLAAFWYLGQIDLEMGWEEMALRNFERAYELDPFNRELAARIEALQSADSAPEAPRSAVPPAEGGGDVVDPDPIVPPDGPAADVSEVVLEAGPGGGIEVEGGEDPPPADGDLATLVQEIDGSQETGPKPDRKAAGAPPSGKRRAERTASIATPTLAEIYVSQGLIRQAVDVLERVSKRDPADEQVRARLEELQTMGGASGRCTR